MVWIWRRGSGEGWARELFPKKLSNTVQFNAQTTTLNKYAKETGANGGHEDPNCKPQGATWFLTVFLSDKTLTNREEADLTYGALKESDTEIQH